MEVRYVSVERMVKCFHAILHFIVLVCCDFSLPTPHLLLSSTSPPFPTHLLCYFNLILFYIAFPPSCAPFSHTYPPRPPYVHFPPLCTRPCFHTALALPPVFSFPRSQHIRTPSHSAYPPCFSSGRQADELTVQSNRIRAHIKMVLEALQELQFTVDKRD